MAPGVYTLDGIPSDLLTEAPLGQRKLKVEATVQAAPPTALDPLYSKAYVYTANGDFDTITTTETSTGNITIKKFTYDSKFNLIDTTVTEG